MDGSKEHRGFTLVELLLVVTILGILAAIAVPKLSSARERSYMSMVVLDLKNLASQQEIYHGDNYSYAMNPSAVDMVVSEGVNITINEADGRGWAATGWHDALPERQCGLFYGAASAGNATPAIAPGVIACTN